MTDEEKELIRARTDLVDLISPYTALKRAGNRFKGLCPFHQEKTPSFTVDPERGRFHCFGCSASGDAFTFLERIENLTFMEAAERLATRAGITLTRSGDAETAKRVQSERDRLFAANAAALQFFRSAFHRSTLAQEYAEKRGLTLQTRDDFGIGYAPDDWSQLTDYLLKHKIHSEDAIHAGLITPSKRMEGEFTDRFRGRLIFPILDVQERVVGFGGRLIVDKPDAPKYLNSPETPVFSKSKTLYALNRARKAITEADRVILVEGYMDVIAPHQAGIGFVVATLGTAMTGEHVSLLRRYTKNIILSFDADNAGVRAALRAAELIAGIGTDMSLRVLTLPPGDDPDSLIRKGRADLFRKAIDAAVTLPEFRLRMLENTHDLKQDGGRLAFLKEAVPVLAGIPNLLERDVLIRRVALYHPSFQVSSLRAEASIRAEVERAEKNGEGAASQEAPRTEYPGSIVPRERAGVSDGYAAARPQYNARNGYRARPVGPLPALPPHPPAAEVAERTLLQAIFAPEWLPVVRSILATLSEQPTFVNALTTQLIEAINPVLRGEVSPRDMLTRLPSEELVHYASAVLMDETGPALSRTAIEDAVFQLKKRQVQTKNEQIRAEIQRNQEGTATVDDETLRQYMLRQKALRGGRLDSEPQ